MYALIICQSQSWSLEITFNLLVADFCEYGDTFIGLETFDYILISIVDRLP